MRRARRRQSELRAVELLCAQNFTSIYDLARPALHRFSLPCRVHFDSFAGFCAKTGVDRASLFPHGGADGLTVRHAGAYVVLYDEQVENERRRAFTLAHELGHILLGHSGEEAAAEEREANAFAASLLCPAAAAYYLSHEKGETLDQAMLMRYFFLSCEAADCRQKELNRAKPLPLSATEITLLLQLFGRIPCVPLEG